MNSGHSVPRCDLGDQLLDLPDAREPGTSSICPGCVTQSTMLPACGATQPKRLYASTAREVFASNDLGETWQPLGIKRKWPLPYARGITVKADDSGVLFAGCGETTTGEKGHVLRTANFGETWETLPLPSQPNATVWGLATHPADTNRIVAFSLFGEVYVTEDAGASWRKIAREFGEIRAAVWLPN